MALCRPPTGGGGGDGRTDRRIGKNSLLFMTTLLVQHPKQPPFLQTKLLEPYDLLLVAAASYDELNQKIIYIY